MIIHKPSYPVKMNSNIVAVYYYKRQTKFVYDQWKCNILWYEKPTKWSPQL